MCMWCNLMEGLNYFIKKAFGKMDAEKEKRDISRLWLNIRNGTSFIISISDICSTRQCESTVDPSQPEPTKFIWSLLAIIDDLVFCLAFVWFTVHCIHVLLWSEGPDVLTPRGSLSVRNELGRIDGPTATRAEISRSLLLRILFKIF